MHVRQGALLGWGQPEAASLADGEELESGRPQDWPQPQKEARFRREIAAGARLVPERVHVPAGVPSLPGAEAWVLGSPGSPQ